MSFMERARALYQRGDAIRAAFILAEGIKRTPTHEEALHWFLQLYVDEVENPGLEQELVRVLDTQPDGQQLFELVCSELTERDQTSRLAFLMRVHQIRQRRASSRRGSPTPVGFPHQHRDTIAPSVGDPIRRIQRHTTTDRVKAVSSSTSNSPRSRPSSRRRRRKQTTSHNNLQGVLPLEVSGNGGSKHDWSNFAGLAENDEDLLRRKKTAPPENKGRSGLSRKEPDRSIPLVLGDSTTGMSLSPVDSPSAGSREPQSHPSGQTNSGLFSKPSEQPIDGAQESNTQTGRQSDTTCSVDAGVDLRPSRLVGESVGFISAGSEELVDDSQPPFGLVSALSDEDISDVDHPPTTPRRKEHLPTKGAQGEEDRYDGQLLQIEHEELWSFGKPLSPREDFRPDTNPVGGVRKRRRFRRNGPSRTSAVACAIVRGSVRVTRLLASGRRGIFLLVLVALLGAGGAWYRTCAGIAREQLARADEAFRQADGVSLQRAVELYEEYLPTEHTAERERLDFTRALLACEFGVTSEESPEYSADEALTAFGLGGLALTALTEGEHVQARGVADEVVRRFPDSWLSHWTHGRIALSQRRWDTAQEDFVRARERNGQVVLPLVGLVDMALRGGWDDEAERQLTALSDLNPDHPLVSVGRAVIAFGVDPLRSRVGNLNVALPDPNEQLLSLRTTELVTYLRARQALAEWRMDEVVMAIRQLRALNENGLGIRVGLLDALTKARVYRLDETLTALDQLQNGLIGGSPVESMGQMLASDVLLDLGRPDLALERLPAETGQLHFALLRARLFVDAGRETEALRLLGQLMDQPTARNPALRLLVDFHLRRGAPERARLRASGLTNETDQAYAAARLALEDEQWEQARHHAAVALRSNPSDLDSLFIWAHATARLGFAEEAIERIDDYATRSILLGVFDRARLEVMLLSNRAPRDTVAEYLALLESTAPTSVRTNTILALAFETVGDLERAAEIARSVIQREPNNDTVRALLERLGGGAGSEEAQLDADRSHLAMTSDP